MRDNEEYAKVEVWDKEFWTRLAQGKFSQLHLMAGFLVLGIILVIASLVIPQVSHIFHITLASHPTISFPLSSDKISALISFAGTLTILVASFFKWWDSTYEGLVTKNWIKILLSILIISVLVAVYFLVK
jgi:hypothetical protein